MTSISINKYIYSILSSDKELKKMVGTNIYPLIAEESVTFPFIVFKKDSIQVEYTKDGRLHDEVSFTINIVANKYEDSINIAERVRSLLELNNDFHFSNTRLTEVNEDYLDDAYIQELSFTTITK